MAKGTNMTKSEVLRLSGEQSELVRMAGTLPD